MERAERLLDLVAMLLDAHTPVPFSEIRAAFPGDYVTPGEVAALRKWERDKAELVDAGVPIRWVADEDIEGGGGYAIDRDAFYLPDLKLGADQLALLWAAGTAAIAEP